MVVPCHFGLEAVTKREIYDLGYEITRVEDGRVTFAGDAEAICRANIFLRSAERVLLQVGRFRATTFDELFEGIKALPWEKVFRSRIPREAIDFVAKLLVYDPNQRPRPLVALVDSYFNELRDPATRLPNGQPLPDLFNFTPGK